MLKEMPLLRAPENSFTGMEIKPNVRYPDQTEAAISSPRTRNGAGASACDGECSAPPHFGCRNLDGYSKEKARAGGVEKLAAQVLVVMFVVPGVRPEGEGTNHPYAADCKQFTDAQRTLARGFGGADRAGTGDHGGLCPAGIPGSGGFRVGGGGRSSGVLCAVCRGGTGGVPGPAGCVRVDVGSHADGIGGQAQARRDRTRERAEWSAGPGQHRDGGGVRRGLRRLRRALGAAWDGGGAGRTGSRYRRQRVRSGAWRIGLPDHQL